MKDQRLTVIPVFYDIVFDHIKKKALNKEQGKKFALEVFELVAEMTERLRLQQYECFHAAFKNCTTTRKQLATHLTDYRKMKNKGPATEEMVRDSLHDGRENIKKWVLAELDQPGAQA